jgi:hypothetical protein
MADYKIKTNKNHNGKEFKSTFRFIGKVSQVSKKDESDSWIKQPIAKQYETASKKQRRLIQFEIETAQSNRLRVELSGMEQQFAYPYSSTHKKSQKVDWVDRNNKDKFPDNTYHPIEVDWDKAERLGKLIKADEWYEVRGQYGFEEFTKDDGETMIFVKRNINSVRPIVNGQVQQDDGTFQSVKHAGEEFDYVTDFNSPAFREVNYFTMQTGIRSTYQGESGDTKVNGVFLDYGKQRSEPKDVELIVYQTEAVEGKKTLADAFASLNTYDFIEATGQDNNRATFAYVDVVEELPSSDPFADVDDTQRVTRKEKVTNGDKKGFEVTSYVGNSLMRDLLTEDEFKKTASLSSADPFAASAGTNTQDPFNDPFSNAGESNNDPFSDPFAK